MSATAALPADIAQHPDPCSCPRCAGLELCPTCGRVKLDIDWCWSERRLVFQPVLSDTDFAADKEARA